MIFVVYISFLKKKNIRNTFRLSNILDPDNARCSISPDLLSGLIWVQNVCHQQTTSPVGKMLNWWLPDCNMVNTAYASRLGKAYTKTHHCSSIIQKLHLDEGSCQILHFRPEPPGKNSWIRTCLFDLILYVLSTNF